MFKKAVKHCVLTYPVVDIEILTEMPAQLELKKKTKKQRNLITTYLSHFSLTETSLASTRNPKSTNYPHLKPIFALQATNHH